MRARQFIFPLILACASCQWETHESTSDHVEIYVPEDRFAAVHAGMTAEQVIKAIGAPRQKQLAERETWQYGVWRGETPSILNWLFSSHPVRATLIEGRIEFASGRVATVQIAESTAMPFPPAKISSPASPALDRKH